MRSSLFLAALLLTSACTGGDAASDPWRSVNLTIPVINDDGGVSRLAGRACRPASDAPATVVVINHGSPPSRDRPFQKLFACDSEASSWFLQRGFVVVEALRRGYGATGGDWAESYGACEAADFVDAGLQGARDITAIVDAATALPFARRDGAIVVGQSAGGWGSLAFSSQAHPNVAAIVLAAPGRGGHKNEAANSNCRPDRLVAAAGSFGQTSRAGLLWLSTANDSYFAPQLVLGMQNAFAASGGVATVKHLGPYGKDGHHLFFGPGGSAIWGPIVTQYLTSRGIAVSPRG